MKFVVVGPALSGNKGAAAMLESTIQTLTQKYPNAEFTLLSHYPTADGKLNTYKNLRIISATPLELGLVINPAALGYKLLPFSRDWLKKQVPAIRAIAEADAVLEEGGITFNDGREVYLLFNIATILPPLLLGTPVVKCAQALGPFKNVINRTAAKLFLPRMAVIVSRGDYTFKNLETLKLKNVVEGADYAFSLEVTKPEAKAAQKYLDHPVFKSGKTIVGVSPSVVIKKRLEKQGIDYIKINQEFIDGLVARGYGVVIAPHSVRAGVEKSHNNDLPLCDEIFAKLDSKDDVYFIRDELSAQASRKLISSCDIFVASRFHAMVAALSTCVPVMVVGWSHKYAEVLKMFGCEELAFDFKNVTSQALMKNFEAIDKKRATIKNKITASLPAVKALSKRHVEFIEKAINDKANS